MGINNMLGTPQGSVSGYFEPGQTKKYNGHEIMPLRDEISAYRDTLLDYNIRLTRIGDRLMGEGSFIVSGGLENTKPMALKLPRGLTINAELYKSNIDPANNIIYSPAVGTWYGITGATQDIFTSNFCGVTFYDGANPSLLCFAWRGQTYIFSQDTQGSNFDSGEVIYFNFNVPIAEWAV